MIGHRQKLLTEEGELMTGCEHHFEFLRSHLSSDELCCIHSRTALLYRFLSLVLNARTQTHIRTCARAHTHTYICIYIYIYIISPFTTTYPSILLSLIYSFFFVSYFTLVQIPTIFSISCQFYSYKKKSDQPLSLDFINLWGLCISLNETWVAVKKSETFLVIAF